MNSELILVHHPEVESRWQGLCYGRTDAQLSTTGATKVPRLADEVAAFAPSIIYSSSAARACAVAQPISEKVGVPVRLDPRLTERDFGEWEGQSWAQIQAADRDSMRRLFDEPEEFAPPNGETLFAVRDRIAEWYRSLPTGEVIVAVSHGGPIGALLGWLEGRPPGDWPGLVPPMGERIRLPLGT